jgi:hypothetical protein
MAGMGTTVLTLWAFGVFAQLCVCILLFSNGNFRRVPIFTSYIVLNLLQAGFLAVIYSHYSFNARISFNLFLMSEFFVLAARALATAELLRRMYAPYSGIWGLAWRALTASSFLVLCYAAADAANNKKWQTTTVDRGLHLVFAIALVLAFLMARYYAMPMQRGVKLLLIGFCFYSCASVLVNTFLQTALPHQFYQYRSIWAGTTIVVYSAVQIVWFVAVLKPITAPSDDTRLLPPSVYQQLSPQLNVRLRLLNERLSRFWKVESRGS